MGYGPAQRKSQHPESRRPSPPHTRRLPRKRCATARWPPATNPRPLALPLAEEMHRSSPVVGDEPLSPRAASCARARPPAQDMRPCLPAAAAEPPPVRPLCAIHQSTWAPTSPLWTWLAPKMQGRDAGNRMIQHSAKLACADLP